MFRNIELHLGQSIMTLAHVLGRTWQEIAKICVRKLRKDQNCTFSALFGGVLLQLLHTPLPQKNHQKIGSFLFVLRLPHDQGWKRSALEVF